jgi:hypothetical protein
MSENEEWATEEKYEAITEALTRKAKLYPGEWSIENLVGMVVIDTLLIVDGVVSVEDYRE